MHDSLQADSSAGDGIATSAIDRLVAIPHLGPGGAQRVATMLLNRWQQNGLRCAVVTLFPEQDAHRLDPGILREDLRPGAGPDAARAPLARLYVRLEGQLTRRAGVGARLKRRTMQLGLGLLRGVRRVRAFILTQFFPTWVVERSSSVRRLRERLTALRPRVVISFLGATNIQTLIAARGLGLKVMISERNDPALQRLEAPWERLRPSIYPEADMVTANSAGALATMRRYVPSRKLRQVANPLVIPPRPEGVERDQQRFVTIARLVQQKGVDLLLTAFAQVAARLPHWRLDIVGDGPLRADLQAQAAALAIADRVAFHGHRSDPFPYLYGAAVFVLPSRFEGMPNAMLEAMGCGLAVIATDASPGPLELIRNEETGLVVPSGDAPALAAAMSRLAEEPARRRRLGDAARKEVASMHIDVVAAQWEALIAEIGAAPAAAAAG